MLASSGLGIPGSQDPAEVLSRAERVRNPGGEFAVDFSIETSFPGERASEHVATYSMIASGRGNSLILMRTPDSLFGGTLLITEGRFWLLLPRTARPFELSESSVLRGDVGLGDLARSDLVGRYRPLRCEEAVLDGERCWRLELGDAGARASYARILYWVARGSFQPRRLEYYGRTGQLLKVARYVDYRTGTLGPRAMRIHVESLMESGQQSIMAFTGLRRINASSLSFTPDGMIPFRDEALRRKTQLGQPSLEQLLPPHGGAGAPP